MVCIGACYTGLEGAKAFSNSLSELVRRLLLFMVLYLIFKMMSLVKLKFTGGA
jgi:hypothetical protein